MSRRIAARYLVSVLLLLGVALPMTGVARAGTTSNALPAAVADASAASVGAPRVGFAEARPHFGFSQASVVAQASAPQAGLQQLQNIPVGVWSTLDGVAPNAPSFDIASFNEKTGMMYFAVRNTTSATVGNSGPGLVVVNTATNQNVGTLSVPNCNAVNTARGSFQCPSGAEVMSDLGLVAVTSRGDGQGSWVEIYNIGADPVNAPLVNHINLVTPACNQLRPDELTYDRINHLLYVANTPANGPTQPTCLAVIDPRVSGQSALLGQINVSQWCPATMEQPRFDLADGFIYLNCSDDRTILRIDATQGPSTPSGPLGAVVGVWSTPCSANGLDMDPETNQALLGCSPGAQTVANLNTPNTANPATLTPANAPPIPVVVRFPEDTASDGLYFNNNTLRWYTGSSGNTSTAADNCPHSPINPAQIPVLGVFQGGLTTATTPTLVGVQCTGNGAHVVGVDTIRNQVYVPTGPSGIPANSNSILVFKDNTPGQTPTLTSVTFPNGSLTFTPSGTGASVSGTLTGITGANVQVVVKTTAGNQGEVVNCTPSGGTITCTGNVVGTPIAGGPVVVAANGGVLARGTTAAGGPPASTLTSQQAITQAQALAGFVSGTTGRPCATQVGQTCQGTGNGLNVVGTVTGSMRWTVTATLPAAPPAGGGTPFFVVTTTAGIEAVPCTPGPAAAPAPGTVVTCTATTVGNALQGAAAVLVFPGVGAAAGPAVGPAIITGPGAPAAVVPAAAAVLPLIPPGPPPLPPLLPPPPPLLPPPPFAMGGGMRPMPEVPVIPEADTLPLLLGGLAALGALAGWRTRRRP